MYKLIAHRGNKSKAKENTLAAFYDAINSDYLGFECDIRQTLDGQFAIYHDPLFAGKLFKKIKYFNLKEHGIELLSNVLKMNTNKIIMLDIKDPFIDVNKFHEMINMANKNIYVMSFYDSVIKKLYQRKRNYKVGVLNYVLNTNDQHFKYDFLCIIHALVNDNIVNKYQRDNRELFIYGVNHEKLKDLYPYYIVD